MAETTPPLTAVRGVIHDGVAHPEQPLEGCEGRQVLIQLIDDTVPGPDISEEEAALDPLLKLIKECQMDTGIADLAHQHDHYLHGKPKRP